MGVLLGYVISKVGQECNLEKVKVIRIFFASYLGEGSSYTWVDIGADP